MRLAARTVDLDVIRTDGGTQVRECLDESWVRELVALYQEEHEIDPILLVCDRSGVHWVADGFHRLEAQRRIGRLSLQATVRDGSNATLDTAKFLAAQANKNGRPLLPGEKRRAILLARSTAEGAKMGVRELARHCGVTKSHVARILEETGVSPRGHLVENNLIPTVSPKLEARWKQIDEALRADPGKTDTEHATELDSDVTVVRRRRKVLGLPKSDTTRRKAHPGREKALDILREHPEWTNSKIAEESGSTTTTVAKHRERLGLPARKRGPVPKEDAPPTAPARKDGDVRDGAQVIRLRPAAPSSPRAPQDPKGGYSSSAARDTAQVALHNVDRAIEALRGADRELFLDGLDRRLMAHRSGKTMACDHGHGASVGGGGV